MTVYTLSDNQVYTSVADETVILQFQAGEYYNLNAVGSFVWNLLSQQPHTISSLVAAVCEHFDTTPTSCESDIQILLQELENEQLIIKNT